MNEQILENVLRSLPVAIDEVTVEGRPGHWVAQISSREFVNVDQSERQRIVWEHLLEKLSDDERVEVEFVFTTAPGDL